MAFIRTYCNQTLACSMFGEFTGSWNFHFVIPTHVATVIVLYLVTDFVECFGNLQRHFVI